MAKIPRPIAYQVDLVEYERGWGSRVDETIWFDNEEEARKYCNEFNAKNTAPTAPDWYMVADYVGPV